MYGTLTGPGLAFVPLINGLKSNLCTKEEQGKVQGLVASIRQLAVGIADACFGTLYHHLTNGGKDTAGARVALWLLFGITAASTGLAWTLPTQYPKPESEDQKQEVKQELELTDLKAAINPPLVEARGDSRPLE